MSIPVPPRIVRRTLRDPLWPLVIGVIALVLGLLAIPGLIAALVSRRRRPLRLIRVLLAALALDLGIVAGCWRLWFRHPPWRRNPAAWRRAHTELLGHRLETFLAVAERAVGLELHLDVEPPTDATDQPLLVLARHVGTGDSLVVVHAVVKTMGRTPRVMLKRFLLWDAAADLLLTRLDSYFLPPRRMHVDTRDRLLEDFARSLGPHDALILFPEGGNWSARRHAASIEWAAANNNAALAEWLEKHPRVLAPRAKGTREMLEESPNLVPIIVTHRGLDQTGSPAQIWQALPLHDPVEVLARQVPRPPTHELEDVERWLQHYWSRIDRWAGELGR